MTSDPPPGDHAEIIRALSAHEPLRDRRAQAEADFDRLEADLDAADSEDADEKCETFARFQYEPAIESCMASWYQTVLPLLQAREIAAVQFRGRIYVSHWLADEHGGDPSFHVSELLVLGDDAGDTQGLQG